MKNTKICKSCNESKLEFEFIFRAKRNYWEPYCKICRSAKRKQNRIKNKINILEYAKIYRLKNKDSINLKRKLAYKKYKPIMIKYQVLNKQKILANKLLYKRNKYHSNLEFKLHQTVSTVIRAAIYKNYKSCLKYLPYSFLELKLYLETLFEPWMNWQNYGVYKNDTWDDNDCSTWKWNIDHIIPQSDLPYISMEDDNFKKCWALDNLRPYSAKQNILDGANRLRHK